MGRSMYLHASGYTPDGVGEEHIATAGKESNKQGWPHSNVLPSPQQLEALRNNSTAQPSYRLHSNSKGINQETDLGL